MASGRTVSGELALRTWMVSFDARHPEGVERQLRQLVWALRTERQEHMSSEDVYWVYTLQEKLQSKYASWTAQVRRLRAISGLSSSKRCFDTAWEEGFDLLTLPSMGDDATRAFSHKPLQEPTKDLSAWALRQSDLFEGFAQDGSTPKLWGTLTRPGVQEANDAFPLAWDWGTLLYVRPVEQSQWDALLAHPLAVRALLATGLGMRFNGRQLQQDEPVKALLERSAETIGLAPYSTCNTSEELVANLNQLSRGMALHLGLPLPAPRRTQPRF